MLGVILRPRAAAGNPASPAAAVLIPGKVGLYRRGKVGNNGEGASAPSPAREQTMSTTTIAVTITPEAAGRAAELGMERELRSMLERALSTIPGLQSINVEWAPPYDSGDERIILDATVAQTGPLVDQQAREWWGWMTETFPVGVGRYFSLFILGTSG